MDSRVSTYQVHRERANEFCACSPPPPPPPPPPPAYMKMTSRVVNNFLNFLGFSTSNDDNHHIRHFHGGDAPHHRRRVYPKKEIHPAFVSNGKATDSVNSLSNHSHGAVSTAIASLKASEESSGASEAGVRVSRRKGTHEAAENKREAGVNIRRMTYLRDTETSARKKRKETLKDLPKEQPLKESPDGLPFEQPSKELLAKDLSDHSPKESSPKEALKGSPKAHYKETSRESPPSKGLPEDTLKQALVSRDLLKEARIDIETLKNQLVSCQKELFTANQKASAAERRVQTVEKERDSVASRLRSTLVDKNAMTNAMEGKLSMLDGRNKKQDAELRRVQEALRASDEKVDQLSKLLDEKTADFKGTQAFLTTADLYSGAEIIGMVETLNAEIFQISAFTAELLEGDNAIATEDERNSNVYQHGDLLDMAAHRIGQDFLEHLDSKHAQLHTDPLPLQLAVQGLLSAQCVHDVQTFQVDELGSNLDQLYQRIKASEVQAVAGRWRAITSATLHDGHDCSSTQNTLEMIVALLCLCGYSTSSQQSRQSVAALQKMLGDLEKLQIKLKTAIKEGITTADFELANFGPGESFNPSWMENVYAESQNDLNTQRGLDQPVLAAVGVGLHKCVTKITPGGEPKNQVDVLYKTKVVLLSVLHLFDEASQ